MANSIRKKLVVLGTPLMFSIFIILSFVRVVHSDCPLPPTPMNCSQHLPAAPLSTDSPSAKPDPTQTRCPMDMLKFGSCSDIPGLVHMVMGTPPSGIPCCAMLGGLARMEMAMCLCMAIKANILGLNLNAPIACSVVLSACQQTTPPGFTCDLD